MAEEAKKEEENLENEEGGENEGEQGGGDELLAQEEIDTVVEDKLKDIAAGMGWRDKDEFSEVPDDWVPAEEFLRTGGDIQTSLKSSVKQLRRQNDNLSRGINDLKTHNEKVYKVEVSRLQGEIDALKTKRRAAVEEGNVTEVDSLDAQIDGLKEEQTTKKTEETKAPETNPDFEEWRAQPGNRWYTEDDEMAAYADTQAAAPELAGLNFERMSAMVTKRVKAAFPEKFKAKEKSNGGKERPDGGSVEGSTRRNRGGKKKFTFADLTESQKDMAKNFERLDVMTVEEYIEDKVKTGELS